MLSQIREKAFWFAQFISRRPVKVHFNEISNVMKNIKGLNKTQYIKRKKEEIVQHTIRTVPYYSKFQNYQRIEDFPVIDKNVIRENYADFYSASYDKKNTISVVTSGSTGTPFEIRQNKEKRYRNTADTIYFAELAGFKIGEKLFYLKIWNDINRKSDLLAKAQNIVTVNVFDLSDGAIGKIVAQITESQEAVHLLGYASAFDSIVKYLEENSGAKVSDNVKSIISMSEKLSHYTQDKLNQYFGLFAVSRYSNNENGILAQQLKGETRFLVNEASYFIEILDLNSDQPVDEGEIGRIVVTDYFNKSMPMIRYDTGYLGVFSSGDFNGSPAKYFESVEGRKMEQIYKANGQLVSSYVITNNMWKYKEIKQYQFIQLGKKEYLFKLNIGDNFSREEELLSEFTGYFGQDANLKIDYVKGIPLLSSGKRIKW